MANHFPKTTKKADITKFVTDTFKKINSKDKDKKKLEVIIKDVKKAWSKASAAQKTTIQDKIYK